MNEGYSIGLIKIYIFSITNHFLLSFIVISMILTISGFEKSILISLYFGAFKLVLKVKSVPSFVMYW